MDATNCIMTGGCKVKSTNACDKVIRTVENVVDCNNAGVERGKHLSCVAVLAILESKHTVVDAHVAT